MKGKGQKEKKTKWMKVLYTTRRKKEGPLQNARCEFYPKITMGGRWLEELGFHVGDSILLEYGDGCIKINTSREAGQEQKRMFAHRKNVLGKCPNCGEEAVSGKYGAYCLNKCGMSLGRVMGVALTDAQVRDLLAGKKILLKGLKSREGKSYDAYVSPVGTEEYSYTKDGEERSGVRFKVDLEYVK